MKKVKNVLLILIFIYLVLYIINITGYYEYSNYTKTILTNEQIEKFENDIKNGIDIDINDYVIKKVDYNNKISRLNYKISSIINKIFQITFIKTLEFLNKITQ